MLQKEAFMTTSSSPPTRTPAKVVPSLPQKNDAATIAQRQFETSVARANYNYMFSYLEPVPMSADVPQGEALTLDYLAKVFPVFFAIINNFTKVVLGLVEKEIQGDLDRLALTSIHDVKAALDKLEKNNGFLHPLGEAEDLRALIKALAAVPPQVEQSIKGLGKVAKDLDTVVVGLAKEFKQIEAEGPTAFLKYTLYDVMNPGGDRSYLSAKKMEDFVALFNTLPLPITVTLPEQPWMELRPGQLPWQADWYFGYSQIAGFNTTILQGVAARGATLQGGIPLDTLLAKLPISDAIFQSVVGDRGITLESAARDGHLFVCDYTMLVGAKGSTVYGLEGGPMRYPVAPIALFYWNRTPPPGYPPQPRGVMQPIAIQLGQAHDPETTPIFTPKDLGKWTVAKTFVMSASAIQHETVAHLGACHLTIEPMIVATNRQLPTAHPIHALLKPHFRFTLAINDDALTSLVTPGGVVATNIGTSIESSMGMVRDAHLAWRFDEQEPGRLFEARGVGRDQLPDFPFRDDTLLVWDALSSFVGSYLRLYYAGDADVVADTELQAWIGDLVSKKCAGVQGMNRLVKMGPADAPVYQIQSLEYLIRVITQIIYIAGPLHASVNYAQYPLLSLASSAPGGVYKAPPTRSSGPVDPIEWLPPHDVALYQVSFVYLLAMIQYDTLGVYSTDPRTPYFADPRVADLVADFQGDLATAEIEIRKRNRTRLIPYVYQLPSMIPNSISI